jgi:hypothetical protein
MIGEFERAILTTDLPEQRLEVGDVGTVVEVLAGGEGYIVEFMMLDGETIDVVVLKASQVRPVGAEEIAHARPLSLPRAAGG